jgi:N-acetylneuraminic acid mutarotase
VGTLEAYDPGSQLWLLESSMTAPAAQTGAAVVGGRFFLPSGLSPSSLALVSDLDLMQVYDPASDSWTALASPAVPRHADGVVAVGSTLYVVGGSSDVRALSQGQSDLLGTVETFDTTSAP